MATDSQRLNENDRASALRVLVADDHAAVRAGVRAFLEPAGFLVVAETETAKATVEESARQQPDVYVVDLNLGECRGPDAVIRLLLDADPSARIVAYSYRTGIATISAAYEAGAAAYVTKSADPDALIKAIRDVSAGHRHFMAGVGNRLAEYHISGEKQTDPRKALSPRERDIFVCLARGRTRHDVAAAMDISAKTVSNLIVVIRNKLGANQAEFTRVAVTYGLIEEDI